MPFLDLCSSDSPKAKANGGALQTLLMLITLIKNTGTIVLLQLIKNTTTTTTTTTAPYPN